MGIDEEISYNNGSGEILLSKEDTGIGGVMIEFFDVGGKLNAGQPKGVFIDNGQQIEIPLRYAYINGELMDYKTGIDAAVRIIPRVSINSDNTGYDLDHEGALVYLSPKTMRGLFGQLYILENSLGRYPSLKLVHSQQESSIDFFNSQGAGFGDNLIYFRGVNGPIKIWKVDYPSNILTHEEFLNRRGEYAEFDNFTFVK